MDLLKINTSTVNIEKSLLIIVIGSLALLRFLAKIKIPFLSCAYDYANFCSFIFRFSIWLENWCCDCTLYLVEGISGLPVFSNSLRKVLV